MFYRGYIKTDGKKSLEKFKDVPDDDLHSLEEAKKFNSYAGVLDKETTLVDFDDEESGAIALEWLKSSGLCCRTYKSTRGYHFLFRSISDVDSCKTHATLACGLIADIKVGSKNSYECLKKDGVEREMLFDTGSPDRLPAFLKPVKNGINFLNMEEGSRNDSLFKHKGALTRAGFSKAIVKEIITNINEHVLPDPLNQREINSILRDEGFTEAPANSKKINLKETAQTLIDDYHFKLIDGDLCVYSEGHYSNDAEELEGIIYDNFDLTSNQRKEILRNVRLGLRHQKLLSDKSLIPFANGILNLETDEMYDYSPGYYITRMFEHNYNPEAYSEIMDKTLDELCCNDSEIRALLEEAVGYIFLPRNEIGQAFVLLGEKSNGKSTFLNVIKALIGYKNMCALDIAQMMGKFEPAQLAGKIANLGDDIGDEFVANPAIFKKLVTGEAVSVQRKGQDPFDMNCTAKFFFSANDMPRIKDRTGAVQRRLTFIPFNAVFTPGTSNYKFNIIDDLTTETALEYLIVIGIKGLKRLLKNKKFTEPKCVTIEKAKYRVDNNSINGFIADCGENEYQIVGQKVITVYEDYCAYCHLNNHKPFGKNAFVRQISRELGIRSKQITRDGEKKQRFIKE